MTKSENQRKIRNGKSFIKWRNQKLKGKFEIESPLSNGEIRNSKENSKWKVFYQMTKSENQRKIRNGKSFIKWRNQKLKNIKRIKNIP